MVVVESRSGQRLAPLSSTDQYLAAILDELRTIRTQLVQNPQEPAVGQPRQVTEPGPGLDRARDR